MVAGQDWTVSQSAVITEQAKANQHPQTKPKTTNQPTFHRSSAGCNAHFRPFSLFQQRPNNYFSASDDVCSRCFDCFVLPIHWFLTFRANTRLLLLPLPGHGHVGPRGILGWFGRRVEWGCLIFAPTLFKYVHKYTLMIKKGMKM